MNNKNFEIDGLVLEGGAMRGMYTAGVLDTFLDNGISAKEIVGVSAGALFGVNFVSKQKGRVIRYNKRFNPDKNYLGLKPLFKEGNIVSTEYAYEKVPHELDPFDDEEYKKSSTKFFAVITNLKTCEASYVEIKSVFEQMDVLRASGSMPFVSKPVVIDDEEYLDGAIADNIPYQWMLDRGSKKTVVILTRDINYNKKPIPKVFCRKYKDKYPLFEKGCENRHILYKEQVEKLKQLEKEGKVFVIRPSEEIKISKTERNPDKLQKVYDLGVKDAIRNISKIKEYLEVK